MAGKNLWITYSWKDNSNQDVDFIAQELGKAGLDVHLDRYDLVPGQRLWDQIQKAIDDPSKCDGWLWVVTQNSLGSEKCKEEFSYALNRALGNRGDGFPVIALFLGDIDQSLITPGIKVRLYVNITSPGWKEQIVAGVERRAPDRPVQNLEPFYIQIHEKSPSQFFIEIRPRAGTWHPFFVTIPKEEKELVGGSLWIAPAGRPDLLIKIFCSLGPLEGSPAGDSDRWAFGLQEDITPAKSAFLMCNVLPSNIVFGSPGEEYGISISRK